MNPFTAIYASASALRNSFFDRGLLPSRRLTRPVVSVGNISTGGSGKTPLVIALGQLLKAHGIPFDVLSRGYRRKTRGVLLVDPNGSAEQFGDEPLLIARRLAVPVIVGESRYQAGLFAEEKIGTQLHLLDDGFQHRSLARDFDIVLVTPDDLHDRLLPSGRLREPLSSLARAHAIVIPADFAMNHPALPAKPLWHTKREIAIDNPPKSPIIFCGIARPDQFFAQVRSTGISPATELVFRDHHIYRQSDIARLQAAKEKAAAGGFVTTEKDAINLGELQSELSPLSIARLTLTLDDPATLVDTILKAIHLSAA